MGRSRCNNSSAVISTAGLMFPMYRCPVFMATKLNPGRRPRVKPRHSSRAAGYEGIETSFSLCRSSSSAGAAHRKVGDRMSPKTVAAFTVPVFLFGIPLVWVVFRGWQKVMLVADRGGEGPSRARSAGRSRARRLESRGGSAQTRTERGAGTTRLRRADVGARTRTRTIAEGF